MPTTQPQLGYGQKSEVAINDVNQWMRSSPWYQQMLASWGQNPNNVHLSDSQRQQVIRAAQAQGVVVDEGDMEVDPSGNFNPKGHKLRNTLIVAGIAAATIATMGAAGAFGGAAGAGAGAGGGGAAGGIGTTGGVMAGLPGAGTALGGVSASVGGGLEAAGGVMAGLPGAGTYSQISAALSGTGYTVNGAGIVMDAAGVPAEGGTLSKIKDFLTSKGMGGLSDTLRSVGQGIGAATSASLNNDQINATARMKQEEANQSAGLTANQQNILGQSQFENELMKRADLEKGQRSDALKNIYRSSFAQNFKGGPYNAVGLTPNSPEYLAALKNLETQGGDQIKRGLMYDTSKLPGLTPYTPYKPEQVSDPRVTPSTMQTVGNWMSPALTVAGQLMKPKSTYDQLAQLFGQGNG